MATTGTAYDEPGPDYYTSRRPDQARQRAVRQPEGLGYIITLNPPARLMTMSKNRQACLGQPGRQSQAIQLQRPAASGRASSM